MSRAASTERPKLVWSADGSSVRLPDGRRVRRRAEGLILVSVSAIHRSVSGSDDLADPSDLRLPRDLTEALAPFLAVSKDRQGSPEWERLRVVIHRYVSADERLRQRRGDYLSYLKNDGSDKRAPALSSGDLITALKLATELRDRLAAELNLKDGERDPHGLKTRILRQVAERLGVVRSTLANYKVAPLKRPFVG